MSHKIFDNGLVAIRKNKVILTLNKPAHIGMRTLELSKVLMQEFHHDYIKNKYLNNSKLLFANIDSLMYEIKVKMSMKILAAMKKCSILAITRLSQDTMMIQRN